MGGALVLCWVVPLSTWTFGAGSFSTWVFGGEEILSWDGPSKALGALSSFPNSVPDLLPPNCDHLK